MVDFVLGVSSSHALGSNGGSETVVLATSQMPPHTHGLYSRSSTGANNQNVDLVLGVRESSSKLKYTD